MEIIQNSLTSHQKMGLEARFHVWTDRNVNRERVMVRTEFSRRRVSWSKKNIIVRLRSKKKKRNRIRSILRVPRSRRRLFSKNRLLQNVRHVQMLTSFCIRKYFTFYAILEQ